MHRKLYTHNWIFVEKDSLKVFLFRNHILLKSKATKAVDANICVYLLRFTYEIAPTFTLMENIVIDHMISKIGWDSGDGILAPGGTISNLYSVLLARYKFDPRVKTEGVHLHKFVIFTSEHVST